ncbi:hypothetical protein EPI10_005073 [Gossypium australe]|uniref:Uncharacterized protein n=1 Tax=Gossypium australe TaxID=47621 RepID=A0A5B6WLU8_9ROSI|nr:hypothetical protein EPI10_005073 [Gossypium australe]
MEKKQNESFRWREVATQVQSPLLEKEMTIIFINTLKAPFINHMLGSYEWKNKRGGSTKRSALRKKENKINIASVYNKSYSKLVTVAQPITMTTSHQGLLRQESNSRPNTEKLKFTFIPMTYGELYQNLFNTHVVSLFYLKPMKPPFPKWYDANARYEFHAGITRHSIENCTVSKKLIERFIKMGIVRFDDPLGPNVVGNFSR